MVYLARFLREGMRGDVRVGCGQVEFEDFLAGG